MFHPREVISWQYKQSVMNRACNLWLKGIGCGLIGWAGGREEECSWRLTGSVESNAATAMRGINVMASRGAVKKNHSD
jgi:hypothetical protein